MNPRTHLKKQPQKHGRRQRREREKSEGLLKTTRGVFPGQGCDSSDWSPQRWHETVNPMNPWAGRTPVKSKGLAAGPRDRVEGLEL